MIEIHNQDLRLCISEQGAEMRSLTDLRDGREVLWQGDDVLWNGTSPILFPNVGRYWQGRYRLNGKEYEQGLHGFVRHRTWAVVAQDETSVTFQYEGTEADKEAYPFSFRVRVRYALEGRSVKVGFEVDNTGEERMYFQIGGHPGFNLRMYEGEEDDQGTLRVEGNVKHLRRASEGGCMETEKYPVPVNEEGFIPVCVETFENEALIFDESQASFVTLFDSRRQPIVAVHVESPVCLIWQPQGQHSPFVCVEPWYGMPDMIGNTAELPERPYEQTAEPHTTWKGGYDFRLF